MCASVARRILLFVLVIVLTTAAALTVSAYGHDLPQGKEFSPPRATYSRIIVDLPTPPALVVDKSKSIVVVPRSSETISKNLSVQRPRRRVINYLPPYWNNDRPPMAKTKTKVRR